MPKSNATFQPEARATTTVKGYNELLAVLHIIVKVIPDKSDSIVVASVL